MRAKFANTTLVIFGAGYIGGHLAEQAIAEGARVTALTRNPERAARLRSLGATVVVADLADTAWHTAAGLRGNADLVVDCVSGGGGLAGYRRSYLDGMCSILAWARATEQAGRLVYTGSTSVYPQGDGARVDETMPTATGDDAAAGAGAGTDVASAVLLETEREALRWPGAAGACVLRLAGIYGPQRHHLLGQLREAAASGAELSGGAEDHLNLIYRDDVCDAIRAAALAPAKTLAASAGAEAGGAVFNIADNAAPTRAELCAWLAQRLGLPELRFSGQPAPGRRRRTPDRIIVNALARRSLGWEPAHPTFREGYEAIFAEEARETHERTRKEYRKDT
ncbi:nucleoside-diphosphate-sugar epimerase [Opitutaceae bacterium TAV1]|nr:nucleoside-diphosphate-sugar epimerase [Opitutaceae bacterium TAV1]